MNEFNSIQSSLEELEVQYCNDEVKEQFFDFIHTVPYIRNLISSDRKRAKDLPRDYEGKIIVDITSPHILEDMDYFRPTAIHYQKTGKLTDLRPNPSPLSEYNKWFKEEVRRCREGYIRPSDGEWITGDYYFFLNYCPILVSKTVHGKKRKAERVVDFPSVWDGHYLKFHYLKQARDNGHHAAELASRGKGKSFAGASLLAKRFILGESENVCKKVQCVVTASEKKYLSGANQILDMFQSYIDFCADNTEFPAKRLVESRQNLQWTMGYVDLDTGTKRGTLNSVIGITSKDDESKLRGSRGVLYLIEEAGTFSHLLGVYSSIRPSVEDGDDIWGQIFLYGTAGDNESDFGALQEIMYNPEGYNMEALPNVFDKEGQGKRKFTYFFPGFMNRAQCYDGNGNSNVTKALLEILKDRNVIKNNSTDISTITKRIAEIPIVPQEAILKTRGNIFPVTQLTQRLDELDTMEAKDSYTGELVLQGSGKVTFTPTYAPVIRDFPLNDNKAEGCVEILEMPEKGPDGTPIYGRYIMGVDPIDDDASNTVSLVSAFVFDLFTDKIVAEWTGRLAFADDCYERVRLLALFYNALVLYENDKKGLYSYFARMNCLRLLADCPEYLRDKYSEKIPLYGNKLKGYKATAGVNEFANIKIKDWLLAPTTVQRIVDGEPQEVSMPNLYFIRNRALLLELIKYTPDISVDRIRAFGAVMLLREEKKIMFGDNIQEGRVSPVGSEGQDDPFFMENFEERFKDSKRYPTIFGDDY